ncbi:MAG: galactokinase [Chloroflexi bacterium]|nr:MAG: galactokinase [Chloroflexota bacterium]
MIRAEAHGRVNLMGEHTDYNLGLVLPTPIPQRTVVQLEPRADDTIRIRARGFGEVSYRLGAEKPAHDWSDYAKACTATLQSSGVGLRGFDAEVTSDVPVGAGVSSSAAFLVALLRAIRDAFALQFDDTTLALLAQRAEVEFVGARVGIMDQLAASRGHLGEALLIDTADLSVDRVELPLSIALVVIDSGVRHAHAGGGYNTRRAECEEAARALGLPSLRNVRDLDALERLPPLLARRVRHVVSENERVQEAAAALSGGDVGRLGQLFDASHASQRDDFDVSIPEVDALAAALRHAGALGARLTGGGFGGSVVAVAALGTEREVAKAARLAYERQSGRKASVILPPP